ncbi:hypothetical protein PYCC9005_005742 [Savitreella phatthalungensis]
MADLDPSIVVDQLDALDQALDTFDAALGVFLSETADLTTHLSGLDSAMDRAKACVALAYVSDSLVFSALQSGNRETGGHLVSVELERAKTYVGKVKATAAAASAKPDTSDPAHLGQNADTFAAAKLDRQRANDAARAAARLQQGMLTAASEYAVGRHTRFANSPLAVEATEKLADAGAGTEEAEEGEVVTEVDPYKVEEPMKPEGYESNKDRKRRVGEEFRERNKERKAKRRAKQRG